MMFFEELTGNVIYLTFCSIWLGPSPIQIHFMGYKMLALGSTNQFTWKNLLIIGLWGWRFGLWKCRHTIFGHVSKRKRMLKREVFDNRLDRKQKTKRQSNQQRGCLVGGRHIAHHVTLPTSTDIIGLSYSPAIGATSYRPPSPNPYFGPDRFLFKFY